MTEQIPVTSYETSMKLRMVGFNEPTLYSWLLPYQNLIPASERRKHVPQDLLAAPTKNELRAIVEKLGFTVMFAGGEWLCIPTEGSVQVGKGKRAESEVEALAGTLISVLIASSHQESQSS